MIFKTTTLKIFIVFLFVYSSGCKNDDTGDIGPNPITTIALNQVTMQMKVDEIGSLSITTDVDDNTVIWSSDNPDVVLVDNAGTVLAIAGGTANITAKVQEATAVCTINVTPDIFVAGREHNGNLYVAKYWKNGQEISLPDGSTYATVWSISAFGSDIYAAGQGITGAVYWKNSQAHPLTDGKQLSFAHSIFVR